MTGLEPHPIFKLPSREQAAAMGQAAFERVLQERARRMALEQRDPFRFGYEPEIWHLVDDLLCDGKEVAIATEKDAIDAIVPKCMRGRREILIFGANGSSKSEYGAKKLMKVLVRKEKARCWAYHQTSPESISRQQPLFWKYLPPEWRPDKTGKLRTGITGYISYSQKNGFAENTFVLPNGSQQWFKNYAQDLETVEGEQLDAGWLDELMPLALVRTIRFRLVRRKGLLILTFTPIKGYTQTVQEYDNGSRLVHEVKAPLLPKKDELGQPTGDYEDVPRFKAAGPGTDGNLKANIAYFHSDDNPYFDKAELYELLRDARREVILERAYGVATKAIANQFPRFKEAIHVIPPELVPKSGSNYHIVDPHDGRNWFMIWMRIDHKGRRYVYREWPTYSPANRVNPQAYIPGIGELGPWAVPGEAADGAPGPAQDALGWSLSRYAEEIRRLETVRAGQAFLPPGTAAATKAATDLRTGKAKDASSNGERGEISLDQTRSRRAGGPPVRKLTKPNPLAKRQLAEAFTEPDEANREKIVERWMDSRYGASPTTTKEASTTLIEQMTELDLDFLAAPGKAIGEGVALINDALDYDDNAKLGQYSPALARLNEPMLYISEFCPNTIYALREWTGKDGNKGACKEPIDDLRYALEADLDYIGEGAFEWAGGGSY